MTIATYNIQEAGFEFRRQSHIIEHSAKLGIYILSQMHRVYGAPLVTLDMQNQRTIKVATIGVDFHKLYYFAFERGEKLDAFLSFFYRTIRFGDGKLQLIFRLAFL
jgi:hypothetical protein